MEDDSTVATNNQEADESKQTGSDAADSTAGDNANNQDTSKSTDTSGDDDKSTNEDKGEDKAPALKIDTDLDDWAAKAGHEVPETDRERALLQKLRNGSRDFTREQQAKKAEQTFNKATTSAKPKVDDDDDDGDPLEKDIKSVKAELQEERALRMRSEYFNSNGVTMDETLVMGEILKEKAERGGKSAFDYWSAPENLQDLHDLAKVRMASKADSSVADEAVRVERERIAKESKANGSTRNATSTSTGSKTEEEQRLERFSNWDPPKK